MNSQSSWHTWCYRNSFQKNGFQNHIGVGLYLWLWLLLLQQLLVAGNVNMEENKLNVFKKKVQQHILTLKGTITILFKNSSIQDITRSQHTSENFEEEISSLQSVWKVQHPLEISLPFPSGPLLHSELIPFSPFLFLLLLASSSANEDDAFFPHCWLAPHTFSLVHHFKPTSKRRKLRKERLRTKRSLGRGGEWFVDFYRLSCAIRV